MTSNFKPFFSGNFWSEAPYTNQHGSWRMSNAGDLYRLNTTTDIWERVNDPLSLRVSNSDAAQK